jgi:sterol 3beta-glucosyltransferase
VSAVEKVLPEDPHNRCTVTLDVRVSDAPDVRFAEFDTEESARDWRRELQGAVYMYRHGRATYLSDQMEEEKKGVRSTLSIFLS